MMSYSHLNSKERRVIFHCFMYGISRAEIARRLGRNRSTVCREIKRGARRIGPAYDDIYAQHLADTNRHKPRHRRRANQPALVAYVHKKLKVYWSPETIAGRLPLDFPDRPEMRISHEQIYQWISVDSRHQGQLHQYLRRHHKYRRRRRRPGRVRSRIIGRVDIDQRPAIVDRRERFGDWEGDTVWGRGNSGVIATHVERKSGYLIAVKLVSRHAESLAAATNKAFERMPKKWLRTITYDNGSEFSDFGFIAKQTGMAVYFAKPHAPWQRGCNENLNGLLGQFFPKSASLMHICQKDIDKVVRLLNNRPRKRLGYLTPHEVLKKGVCVALGS